MNNSATCFGWRVILRSKCSRSVKPTILVWSRVSFTVELSLTSSLGIPIRHKDTLTSAPHWRRLPT